MNLYGRTFGVLKPYWKPLVVASGSAALHAIFAGLLVWMFGPLLMVLFQIDSPYTAEIGGADAVEQVSTTVSDLKGTINGWINQAVAADSRRDMLVNFCWLALSIVVAKNLFHYLQGFFMAFVHQSVIRSFRNRLFEKYQRLSLGYFHRRRTGQIISRVTNDVTVLNDAIDIGFNRLVTDSVMTIVLTSFLLILSWKLTLLSMVIMPVVFGFIWFVGYKMRKYSARSQEKMADVNSVLEEVTSNIRIVKAFSMEPQEIRRFFVATGEYFRALLRMTRIRHLASPINDTLATLAGIMILLYSGTRIIEGTGELTAGDFMTFVVAMLSLIKPVKSLSQVHIKVQEGMAAAERIFNVLDATEDVQEQPQPRTIEKFQKNIRYESLSFSYNANEPVLTDISFEVNRGEVVAVVGPSGAGKSTLLDLLPRFYDPGEGRISIDGHDIRDLSLKSLRGLMGIVTQETYLFNDTIRNNIAYGSTGIAAEKVIEAATMANAHEFISEFENGYETLVGNRGVMLSGGQRQRIAIARALLRDPQVLIFDEATSALDTESEMLVQEAIDRLMTNRTALVIAHRLSTIKNADRIMVIDKGHITESGTHDDLLGIDGLYKRLYDMQFRGKR
ncbi:MAG: ABC transporter ATP-binding protein/permease [candidate division Zixibacteria bacterium]|nr:ABC transporter ATP-binding protein/permease [candidate division Zixibacteria bacterium]